jgi:hypothetical protein
MTRLETSCQDMEIQFQSWFCWETKTKHHTCNVACTIPISDSMSFCFNSHTGIQTTLLHHLTSTATTPHLFFTRILVKQLQAELTSSKNTRNRRISLPFPLDTYLSIFPEGVGDQIPPVCVNNAMVYSTYVYEDDLAKLGLPTGWRDRACTKSPESDLFRISSMIRPTQQARLMKKRKKKNDGNTRLFTATYDIGSQQLKITFSFHKFPPRARV